MRWSSLYHHGCHEDFPNRGLSSPTRGARLSIHRRLCIGNDWSQNFPPIGGGLAFNYGGAASSLSPSGAIPVVHHVLKRGLEGTCVGIDRTLNKLKQNSILMLITICINMNIYIYICL